MNRKTEFFLYALGKFYHRHKDRLEPDLLDVAVQKSVFIRVLREASITRLSERMVYRHLEAMEGEKLINYDNRELTFTAKGMKRYLKIRDRFEDYFNLGAIMREKDITAFSKRSQTHFKGERTK